MQRDDGAREQVPYDRAMARTQTMVQLRDDLIDLLDAEAADRGTSRSAIIREAVELHLANSARARTDREIVAGYERIPQAIPDEWGSLVHAGEVAARETVQRLDAEEAAGGHEPW